MAVVTRTAAELGLTDHLERNAGTLARFAPARRNRPGHHPCAAGDPARRTRDGPRSARALRLANSSAPSVARPHAARLLPHPGRTRHLRDRHAGHGARPHRRAVLRAPTPGGACAWKSRSRPRSARPRHPGRATRRTGVRADGAVLRCDFVGAVAERAMLLEALVTAGIASHASRRRTRIAGLLSAFARRRRLPA